jgi:hypothetical protein
MIPSKAGKEKQEQQNHSSVPAVSSTPNAAIFEEIIRQHAQQQHLQQQSRHRSMPPTASNQLVQFPLAAQQWQQQHQLQSGFVGAQSLANAAAPFYTSAATSAPVMFMFQNPRSMVYESAVASAAGLFQSPNHPRSAGHYTQNGSTGGGPIGSSSCVDATTAFNLAAQVALLRQEQQHRAASATHVSAAEQFASNPVDGGSLYLQERLGGSTLGRPQSVQRIGLPALSYPSLTAFSNQSDLESAAASVATGLGLPATTNDGTELSRRTTMLHRHYVTAPVSTSTGERTQTGTSSTDPTLAVISSPRFETKLSKVKNKVIGSGSERSSSSSQNAKQGRLRTLKKRSPKQMPKVPRSIYTTASSSSTPVTLPFILYSEDDDDYLTPYQCLLRKQLEVFVADPEDVRCSSQQGRTTNIQVGQVGLRCRHCEGGLASRTKGAVYYSHSVDGIYQIGQNIGKVHLAERCYRIPDDVRRNLIALRNDSRRASSGKAYWADRIRALGVYEEGNILKYRGTNAVKDSGVTTMTDTQVESTAMAPKNDPEGKRSKTSDPDNDQIAPLAVKRELLALKETEMGVGEGQEGRSDD